MERDLRQIESDREPFVVRINQGQLENLNNYIESSGQFVSVYGYVLKGIRKEDQFQAQLKEFTKQAFETREKFSVISNTFKNGLPVVIESTQLKQKRVIQVVNFGDEAFYQRLIEGLFFSPRRTTTPREIAQALESNGLVELRFVQ